MFFLKIPTAKNSANPKRSMLFFVDSIVSYYAIFGNIATFFSSVLFLWDDTGHVLFLSLLPPL